MAGTGRRFRRGAEEIPRGWAGELPGRGRAGQPARRGHAPFVADRARVAELERKSARAKSAIEASLAAVEAPAQSPGLLGD